MCGDERRQPKVEECRLRKQTPFRLQNISSFHSSTRSSLKLLALF